MNKIYKEIKKEKNKETEVKKKEGKFRKRERWWMVIWIKKG